MGQLMPSNKLNLWTVWHWCQKLCKFGNQNEIDVWFQWDPAWSLNGNGLGHATCTSSRMEWTPSSLPIHCCHLRSRQKSGRTREQRVQLFSFIMGRQTRGIIVYCFPALPQGKDWQEEAPQDNTIKMCETSLIFVATASKRENVGQHISNEPAELIVVVPARPRTQSTVWPWRRSTCT